MMVRRMTKTMNKTRRETNKSEQLTIKRMKKILDSIKSVPDELPRFIIIGNGVSNKYHKKLISAGWEHIGEYLPGWQEYNRVANETKKP